MPILLNLFFNNQLAKIGVSVVALLSLVGLYSCEQRNIGAVAERSKIERQANENVVKAEAARGASLSRRTGRMLDPNASNR